MILEPTRLDGLEPGEPVNFQKVLIRPSILLMLQKSGEHLLRLVVYPTIYKALYIPGGCLGFLNHQQYVETLWYSSRWSWLIWCSLMKLVFWLHFQMFAKENLELSKSKWSQMKTCVLGKKVWKYAKSQEFSNPLIIPFILWGFKTFPDFHHF